MEGISNFLVWSSVLLLLALMIWRKSKHGIRRTPPGPGGWPIVGSMFDLGAIPHQTLYKLKFKYGPLLWLKLGSMNTMVVQSAAVASEMFKNHDSSFLDRKNLHVFTAHDWNKTALSVCAHGPYSRMLKRLYVMELMANKRINQTAPIRRKCIDNIIKYIEDEMAAARARGEAGEVNLGHFLFLMAFNIVGNLALSRDLLDHNCREGHQFTEAVDKVMVWSGTPNIADFFPFLKWLDPQKIKRNMTRDMGQAMEIIAGFVKERIQEPKLVGKEKVKDFLDVLLEYEGGRKEGFDKIPHDNIIKIILEMFIAASDTTSSTMEWTMAELLRKPTTMKKLQEELNQVVGQNRKVEESDIDRLPYLQAVLKEALRLHPPLTLLIPRNTIHDTNFMGYHIPKDTQVLVNAWAIGRDTGFWEDPLSFNPERFLGSSIDYKGHNFELIPFGSGRRICPGLPLAHQVIHLGLASLLHSFDWELAANENPETMDMNERMGITVRKLEPLKVIPKKRAQI